MDRQTDRHCFSSLVLPYLPSVRFVHPAIFAKALKLGVRHASPGLIIQSSAETEHPPALKQGSEFRPTAAFLVVLDVTARSSG